MKRLAALALLLVFAGCENTDFYHATTRDWLGPYTSSAPAAARSPVQTAPAASQAQP
jgi:hypothetical protein